MLNCVASYFKIILLGATEFERIMLFPIYITVMGRERESGTA
jgi:hypothetical protein